MIPRIESLKLSYDFFKSGMYASLAIFFALTFGLVSELETLSKNKSGLWTLGFIIIIFVIMCVSSLFGMVVCYWDLKRVYKNLKVKEVKTFKTKNL